jgi:hypothetical protein
MVLIWKYGILEMSNLNKLFIIYSINELTGEKKCI